MSRTSSWWIDAYNLTQLVSEASGKALVRRRLHGGYITHVIFEIPFTLGSALEWIDYLPPSEFWNIISSLEKIVFKSFWGFRPLLYGVITLFDWEGVPSIGDRLSLKLSDGTPLNYRVDGATPLADIIMSYSSYYPSLYRPAIKVFRGEVWKIASLWYLNVPTSPAGDLFEIVFSGEVILPPDPLGLGGEWWLYPWDMGHVEEAGEDDIIAKYIRLASDFNLREGSTLFIPVLLLRGSRISGELIRVDNGSVHREGLIYESEEFVIDLSMSYSGGKRAIHFKRFRYEPPLDGHRVYINIGVSRLLPPPSHMIIEYWRDNKLLMSSPSKKGFIELPLLG